MNILTPSSTTTLAPTPCASPPTTIPRCRRRTALAGLLMALALTALAPDNAAAQTQTAAPATLNFGTITLSNGVEVKLNLIAPVTTSTDDTVYTFTHVDRTGSKEVTVTGGKTYYFLDANGGGTADIAAPGGSFGDSFAIANMKLFFADSVTDISDTHDGNHDGVLDERSYTIGGGSTGGGSTLVLPTVSEWEVLRASEGVPTGWQGGSNRYASSSRGRPGGATDNYNYQPGHSEADDGPGSFPYRDNEGLTRLLVAVQYLGSFVPAAPTGVTATHGNGQSVVNWEHVPAAKNGGNAVLNYTATAISTSNTFTCTATGATATNCTIMSLTNGATYSVAVVATNSAGDSPASTDDVTALPGIPAAPTGVTLTAGDGQIVVEWTAPTDTGASAITGYIVEPFVADGGKVGSSVCTITDPAVTNCTITGLTNGTRYRVVVRATNSHGNSVTSANEFATPMVPALALPNVDNQVYTVTQVVNLTLPEATGGTAPTTYTLTRMPSGNPLPPGLTFDATARTISGSPTAGFGPANARYTATDADGTSVMSDFTVRVFAAPLFPASATIDDQTYNVGMEIPPLTLPEATGGATSRAYTLTPSASIPSSLTFDPATRVLSGTPDATALAADLTYTVADANGITATLTFALTVIEGLVFDTTTTAAPESVYQYPVNNIIDDLVLPPATGGTGTLSYALNGVLPMGLTFSTNTRTLSGTPTVVVTDGAALTYTVTDSAAPPNTLALTFEVNVRTAVITWTGGTFVETAANDGTIMGDDVVATLVGDTFVADVCTAFNYTAVLPEGLTLACTRTNDTVVTFTYSGTAENHADADDAVGAPPYDILRDNNILFSDTAFTNSQADDVANSNYFGISFDFNDTPPLVLPNVENQVYTVTQVVNVTLPAATGGAPPIFYRLVRTNAGVILPPGLVRDNTERIISGIPTESFGPITMKYSAVDDEINILSTTFTIQVVDVPTFPTPIDDQTYNAGMAITPLTLPAATDGASTLAYTLTPSADIPSGLTFDPATRVLSGIPDATALAADLTYTVADANGITATLTFALTVIEGLVFDTTTTAAPESVYQYPVNNIIDDLVLPPATGGTGTLSYALNGVLPMGLTFSTNTRTLSGTPTVVVTDGAALTYTVTDSAAPPNTLALTFEVNVRTAVITWTGGTFVETAANDGTIMGDDVVATLVGDTFVADVCTAFNYTAVLPEGLTLACTRTNDTVVTFTYSGTAENHADADDAVGAPPYDILRDNNILFSDTAFTNSQADDVANSNYFGISFDFNDPPPLVLPNVENQVYTVTQVVNFTLPEATGGTGLYTYTLTPTANIPSGLTFTPADRTLTGMPTAVAPAAALTYTVTDSTSTTASQTFSVTIRDTTPPTVTSVRFYDTEAHAMTGTADNTITEAQIGNSVYVSIQFSENMRNVNHTITPFVQGIPRITQKYIEPQRNRVETLQNQIIAHDAAFPDFTSRCRAAGAPPTDRYLCRVLLLSTQHAVAPLTIVMPGEDNRVTDVAGNTLAAEYTSSELTLSAPVPPSVTSVKHYPSAAAAIADFTSPGTGGTITDTWDTTDPIYSVIQFAGPALESLPIGTQPLNTLPTARPQIFHQLGTTSRVQFGIRHLGGDFRPASVMPPQMPSSPPPHDRAEGFFCQLFDEGTRGIDSAYWCSYAPGSGSSGTYKIIVGAETVTAVGVKLGTDWDMDTGITLAVPFPPLSLPTVANSTYTVGIAIPTLTLPEAISGTGPYTYTLTPADNIPPDLTFTPADRTLTGTPTTVAPAAALTYTVTDSTGTTASQTFSVTIEDAVLSIDYVNFYASETFARADTDAIMTAETNADVYVRVVFSEGVKNLNQNPSGNPNKPAPRLNETYFNITDGAVASYPFEVIAHGTPFGTGTNPNQCKAIAQPAETTYICKIELDPTRYAISDSLTIFSKADENTVAAADNSRQLAEDFTSGTSLDLIAPSDNTTLSALGLTAGGADIALSPDFALDVLTYTASALDVTTTVTVTATVTGSTADATTTATGGDATVAITATAADGSVLTATGTAADGSITANVSGLTTGDNTLTVTVTAEDGMATQDYVITLTVPAALSIDYVNFYASETDARADTGAITTAETNADVYVRVVFSEGVANTDGQNGRNNPRPRLNERFLNIPTNLSATFHFANIAHGTAFQVGTARPDNRNQCKAIDQPPQTTYICRIELDPERYGIAQPLTIFSKADSNTVAAADSSRQLAVDFTSGTSLALIAPSDNTTLSVLTLAADGAGIDLIPDLTAGVLTYTASVLDVTTTVTVTATVSTADATTATGGDATVAITGTAADGSPLTATGTAADGSITANVSGMTTGDNTLTVTVTAEDGSTQDYTITLTVSASSLALDAIDDQFYTVTQQVNITLPEATGAVGGLTYSLTRISGSPVLPPDLSFDASARTISGSPTVSFGGASGATLRYTASDFAIGATISQQFNMQVTAAPAFPVIVDQNYILNREIIALSLPQATGGTAPLTYTLTPSIPPGLTLTAGVLSGTPTAAAATTMTYTVTDANDISAALTFPLIVAAADMVAPVFTLASDETNRLLRPIPSTDTATTIHDAQARDDGRMPDAHITYGIDTASSTLSSDTIFSLNTMSGTLTLTAVLDTENTYNVTITATDEDGNVARQYLAVEVNVHPTVTSIRFYETETEAIAGHDTNGIIDQVQISTRFYVDVQFSERMQQDLTDNRPNIAFSAPDLVPGLFVTTQLSIIAHDEDFDETNTNTCRAISEEDTSRYICNVGASHQSYRVGTLEVLVRHEVSSGSASGRVIIPNKDLAGNSLLMTESASLTLTPVPVLGVTSVTHYPSLADAQTDPATNPLASTAMWETREPIYSIIQFAGRNPRNVEGRDANAQPQIFYQIGMESRVQFEIQAPASEAVRNSDEPPKSSACRRLDTGQLETNGQYWCNYTPTFGESGTYKIIVGSATETPFPTQTLGTDWEMDDGITLAVPSAGLTIGDVTVDEGVGSASITVGLESSSPPSAFLVDVSTADGTATTADLDYTALTGHTLTFAGTADETKTVSVTINDDDTPENSETLTLTLSNARPVDSNDSVSILLPSPATVTITNNDELFGTAVIADQLYGVDDAVDFTLPPAVAGLMPFTYTLTRNTNPLLPNGLTFDGPTHTISGAPSQPFGVSNSAQLVYTVTDNNTPSIVSSLTFGMRVLDRPTVTITDSVTGTPDIVGIADEITFTFAFSESVNEFGTAGITVENGTGASFMAINAMTYTLTVTPTQTPTNDGVLTVTVMDGAATGVNSTLTNRESSATQAYDTQAPTDPTFDGALIAEDDRINAAEQTAGGVIISGTTGTIGSETSSDTSSVTLCAGATDAADATCEGGTTFDATAAAAATTWSYTLNAAGITALIMTHGEGEIPLTVIAADVAGNTAVSASRTITVDIAAPVFGITGTTSASPEQINVTLGTAADTVIHDAQATDNGVTDTGLTYTLTGTDAGTFSLSATGELSPVAALDTETTYSIEITATDEAGNAATQYLSVVVADIPILDITSDVGIDNTANIADGRITFTAVWSEAVNDFRHGDVTVTGGAFGGELTLSSNDGLRTYTFTVNPNPDTNDGVITIAVRAGAVTPTGGGNASLATSETQAYDTRAPFAPTITTPVAGPDNTINSAEATATVALGGGGVEAGGSITLCLPGGSGTPCGNGGTLRVVSVTGTDWAYTLTADDITAMEQGDETLTVIANDAAGNPSPPTMHDITVDTMVTAPTITTPIAVDGFINAAEQTIGFTVDVTSSSDANGVTLCLGDTDVTDTACGGTSFVTTGGPPDWSYMLTADNLSGLAEGALTFTAIASDEAGNMAVSAAEMVTVDTMAPGAPTISAVATDDTINDAEQRAGVPISGTTDTATTVTLCFGGSDAACTGGSTSTATVTGTVWTYTLDTADYIAMGQGDETLRATATDAAGNPSTETTLDIDIDTVLPVFPGTTTNATERMTISVATGTVAGTNIYDADAADNDVLTEVADTGLTYTLGGTDAATFTLNTNNGMLTPMATLATVATYSVNITATDEAGNAATQYLTIAVVDRPTVAITNDAAGAIANIADRDLTFTFAWFEEVRDFVTADIAVDGGMKGAFTRTNPSTGNPGDPGTVYTLVVTPTPNTAGTITVTVADDAATATGGARRTNLKTDAMQTYDTQAPAAPTIDVIASDDVINAEERDAGTPITGVTFTGTADSATNLALCFNDGSGSVTDCTGGTAATVSTGATSTTWDYILRSQELITLGEAPAHVLRVAATDPAGNPASSIARRTFAADYTPPAAPTFDAPVSGDDRINAVEATRSLTFSGGVESGAMVSICRDDFCSNPGEPILADNPTLTTWRWVMPANIFTVINDGVTTFFATAIDSAGNEGEGASHSIIVDRVAPVFDGGATGTGTVAVNVATTVTVYDANATDNGGDADAGVMYDFGGGTDDNLFSIDAATGVVTYRASPPAVTIHNIIVTATDTAGNPATQVVTISVLAAPSVRITDNVPGEYANGASPLTFTLTWSEPVTGFAAEDITVNDVGVPTFGTATTKEVYTLEFPSGLTANNDGVLTVTVAANAVIGDNTNAMNAAATAEQKYDNVAPVFAPDTDTDTATFVADDPITTTVYDANATDGGDADAGITYRLSGTNAGLFAIVPGTGVVTYLVSPTEMNSTGHTFVVTATDKGGNIDTITVTVTVVASANATLSALSVTPAGDTALPLTPDFSPTTTAYTANAPAFTGTVTVAAAATDSEAMSVQYAIGDPASATFAAGGTFITVMEGPNTLTARVTAENGNTMQNYTITLTVPTSTPAAAGTATPLTFTPPDSTTPTTVYVTVPVAGDAAVTPPLPTTPPAPAGVAFGPTVVDIAFDTDLGGRTATVCLPTTGIPAGRAPLLFHYDNTWEKIGDDIDTRDGFVCGTTTSFSGFASGWETADAAAAARMNEQILTPVTQAMVADTLAAVGERVEAIAGGTTLSVTSAPSYQFGGQSSMRGLFKAHGKSMLEDNMEIERLLDGASFVVPLRAAGDDEGIGAGGHRPVTMWGAVNYRNLDGDEKGLDWDGDVRSTSLGMDVRVSETTLAGVALSLNLGEFDYDDTGGTETNSGEYEYDATNISPYFGWFPHDGFSLWATAGIGSGEIDIETQGRPDRSTDTAQHSLAAGMKTAGMKSRIADGNISMSVKGDISAVWVTVDEAKDGGAVTFIEQDIDSQRVRLLLSGEYARSLSGGGSMTPSLEIGARHDAGDGVTGTGLELGGGIRYTNAANTLSLEGGIRTLESFDYDEFGANLLVRLSPPFGRGLSLSLHPVWGSMQSSAQRLWDEGASELGVGGDKELQSRMDSEVGYGIATTMLGSVGMLTPYTGMTTVDGGVSHVRLGGRFVGGDGLRLNLEGAREHGGDEASHTVLLRGEFAF